MNGVSSHKNLRLLWWLRGIAIAGQAAAILVVTRLLDIPLPEASLWAILGLQALLNLFTGWWIRGAQSVTDGEFFAQLMLDMAALAGMLYFAGGASNPFAPLFIVQVVIAAVTLPPRYAWAAAAMAVALYTALMFWNVEVPYFYHHHIGDFFNLHVQGMWLSFIMLAGIVAWFVVRMNGTLRRQHALLAEAEKIAALGTLATACAHELGTPLATMAVLAEDCPEDIAAKLQGHVKRCKTIISRIAAEGGVMRAESGAPMGVRDFLEGTMAEWCARRPGVPLARSMAGEGNPRILAEHSLHQALVNVLDNAADASPHAVHIEASWTPSMLRIRIRDEGAGLPQEVRDALGEPGVTTKPEGLGLGLFLAKSVVARLGGSLELVAAPVKGTVASIALPLRKLAV